MQRAEILDAVREILTLSGFSVSDRCDLRPVSFDLVARRERDLLLVKVLTNVDALTEPIAAEIKLLCKFLQANPLLVGIRSGAGFLEDGVIYARHDIPIVTPGTLAAQFLEGARPMVFAAPGGLYVRIDGLALRAARVSNDLSLGTLAQIAGVSRRAIQMYEEGMNASIDAAMRLEEYFKSDFIRSVDPSRLFDPQAYQPTVKPEPTEDPFEQMILRLLRGLGYEVQQTRRSPFQALSKEGDSTLLTGMLREGQDMRRRARIVSSISGIVQRPGFFIVHSHKRDSIEGVPLVDREELLRLDPETLLELILERQARQD